MDPAAGRLLIATPSLVDPNFSRSIVLLIEQGDEGVLGVVLNRPLQVEVGRVLDGWDRLVDQPEVLFGGGPVQTEVALAVARVLGDEEPMGWRRLAGELGLLDLDAPVELLEQALSSLRIFAGYAGWSAGQLEAEIEEGSWIVVPVLGLGTVVDDRLRARAQLLAHAHHPMSPIVRLILARDGMSKGAGNKAIDLNLG
jgi:putative transcriptional regulator